MADYRVKWEIDVFDVDSAEDAAREALRIQRDPASTATVFDVLPVQPPGLVPFTTVDLDEVDQ